MEMKADEYRETHLPAEVVLPINRAREVLCLSTA
jgi:hypothetical protein